VGRARETQHWPSISLPWTVTPKGFELVISEEIQLIQSISARFATSGCSMSRAAQPQRRSAKSD
jgi:hypothetical protein